MAYFPTTFPARPLSWDEPDLRRYKDENGVVKFFYSQCYEPEGITGLEAEDQQELLVLLIKRVKELVSEAISKNTFSCTINTLTDLYNSATIQQKLAESNQDKVQPTEYQIKMTKAALVCIVKDADICDEKTDESQIFRLKWERADVIDEKHVVHAFQEQVSLRRGFDQLRTNNVLTDFAFDVEGQTIPVHRVILAAQSSHFATFFAELPSSIKKDHITKFKFVDFQRAVDFMYRGEFVLVNQSIIDYCNLLEIGYTYAFKTLIETCSTHVIGIVNPLNVCDVLLLALRNNDNKLALSCDFCAHRFKTIDTSQLSPADFEFLKKKTAELNLSIGKVFANT